MRLTSEWETSGTFERTFTLEDDEGTVLEAFGDHPTLDQLREAEREHGERIQLTNIGLPCANCANQITDRFAADPRGNLLCWDCATTADSTDQAGVRVNTDPTKAVLSESKLHEKSLCDYVINVATGCRHGCTFCYVPTTPGYERREGMLAEQADVHDPQREWGSYLLYRDDLPERLHATLQERDFDDWKETDRGRGVVMLSSGTDPYQDRRTAQITRAAVQELIAQDIPVRILTRSPAVVRDKDLYAEHSDLVTVGSSIPCWDEDLVRAIEPGAPPPKQRWEALDELQRAGVPVYVSMSPTYPTMSEDDIFHLLGQLAALGPEVVFHEPINPRGENFQMLIEAVRDAELTHAVEPFEKLTDEQNWVGYAVQQLNTVQRMAQRFESLQVHSWPDRELVGATSGELQAQLRAMRNAVSPESINTITSESPACQSPLVESEGELRSSI